VRKKGITTILGRGQECFLALFQHVTVTYLPECHVAWALSASREEQAAFLQTRIRMNIIGKEIQKR
jgi:hypothetical protein